MSQVTQHPNVVLILADNLGWGELGCYGGGAIRGAPTPRIDALAAQGTQFLNFNVESDCVPTRSALMTGRHPVRTGAMQSVPAGLPQGLVPWERTLAQAFSEQGYATAMYGKWHLGDKEGRYPKDRGFDEWYGIPRTTNESMFMEAVGFDPDVVEVPYVMEGRKGSPAERRERYDLEMRRRIDEVLTQRSCEFIGRHAGKAPFFLYVPLTQLHFPTIPHREFEAAPARAILPTPWWRWTRASADPGCGRPARHRRRYRLHLRQRQRTGVPPALARQRRHVDRHLSHGDGRGAAGPAHRALAWQGAGRQTNEIVHVVDLFPTLAGIAGLQVSQDRPIDGVDQSAFLLGREEKSAREGFVYYIKNELRAAKWRDWKMHVVWEVEPNVGPNHLETPYVFNLMQDPKEETDVNTMQGWVRGPIRRMVNAFQASLKSYPPIPPGAPDDYAPSYDMTPPAAKDGGQEAP